MTPGLFFSSRDHLIERLYREISGLTGQLDSMKTEVHAGIRLHLDYTSMGHLPLFVSHDRVWILS